MSQDKNEFERTVDQVNENLTQAERLIADPLVDCLVAVLERNNYPVQKLERMITFFAFGGLSYEAARQEVIVYLRFLVRHWNSQRTE